MTEKHAIERASWAASLRRDFAHHGFQVVEVVDERCVRFEVSHPDSPGWLFTVRLAWNSRRRRNCIQMDTRAFFFECASNQRQRLMVMLTRLRRRYSAQVVEARQREATAEELLARQGRELQGMEEVRGLEATLIHAGPYAGQYRVELKPGNPLEHLTLDQYRILHSFLKSLC